MTKKTLKLVRGGVFVLLFLILLSAATTILKPKWYGDSFWEPVTLMHDGFYSLERDSTDVIFIGSSQVYDNINPIPIWHEFGISSYDLSSSSQRVWISEYYVNEALKFQHPKVIALEVGSIFNDTPNDEDRNRKALDYMKLSANKWKAIATTVRYSPDESFASYLFPIMRFHTRWESLAKEDFEYFSSDKHYFLRGFSPRYGITVVQDEDWMLQKKNSDVHDVSIPDRCREYLDDIVSICDENNISLVLFRTPSVYWSMGEHNCIDEYAELNGIDFIDFNMLQKEINLNETDFLDVTHLNVDGANKISTYFGDYLKNHYEFEDASNDALWQKDYEDFELYDVEKRSAR